MSRSLAALVVVVVAVHASAAEAQSRGTGGARPSAARSRAIRAELADVLLQSRRYDDAAREYRALLYAEPENRLYRLQLARALAWGERFREAESELRLLASRQPGNPTVDTLLLSVREAMTPTADEAAQWVERQPGSTDYRLMYARALAREGRLDEAMAQYDALLPQQRSAKLLLERAYVHMDQRHYSDAETDLFASIAMGASVDALLTLGDLRRWRGDLGSAHKLFSHARSIAPKSPEVAAAFARLARDERPAVAFLPMTADAKGWQTTSTSSSDNLGAFLTTLSMRRGFALPRGVEGSVGVKALHLNDRTVSDDDIVPVVSTGVVPDLALGYGADVALSGEANYRELYARARARSGAIHHPDADLVTDAALTLTGWWRAWGAGIEMSTGPAYPSFVTMASFIPLPGTRTQLQERATTISLAGPVRRLDVALRSQSSSFNDGNARDAVEAFVRLPAGPLLALLYSGSSLGFAEHSVRYWDPIRYTAHSGGVELAQRRARGLSFAARVLPGMAWATERHRSIRDSTMYNVSPQVSGGAEASYRNERWEMGATLGYGRGRTGSYERFDAMVQVRYVP